MATVVEADPRAELQALGERLQMLRKLLEERSAVAMAARELLARESTHPRRRQEVEAKLRTAAVFDVPMLEREIAETQIAIAKLKAQQEPLPELAILADRPGSSKRLARKRRQLGRLVDQRGQAATLLATARQNYEIAVSTMQDLAGPRAGFETAVTELTRLDREIDALGAEVKRLDEKKGNTVQTSPGVI
jgi:hypothetical protein